MAHKMDKHVGHTYRNTLSSRPHPERRVVTVARRPYGDRNVTSVGYTVPGDETVRWSPAGSFKAWVARAERVS